MGKTSDKFDQYDADYGKLKLYFINN